MKALIVYYSHSGNNESLAKELRLRFGCDIIKIEEQKRRTSLTILLDLIFKREPKIRDLDVYLNEYKTIIFIAPIWDSKIATPLVSYLKKEQGLINSYAFITVCGGREGQKQKITDQLYQLTYKKPIAVSELQVNELLPVEQKGQVKYVTSYRVKDEDFNIFKKQIQDFVNVVFSYSMDGEEKKSFEKYSVKSVSK